MRRASRSTWIVAGVIFAAASVLGFVREARARLGLPAVRPAVAELVGA